VQAIPKTPKDIKPITYGAGLERDSFLDILARFIHLQVEEKRVAGR